MGDGSGEEVPSVSKIVLFGATGYTGRLAASAMSRRGAPLVLAGRDQQALESLADELDGPGQVEFAVARVGDDGLERLLDEGDVLVSTVGPFTTIGETAVRAAIARRATHVDSAGEGGFHRRVFDEWGPAAATTGVGLLSGIGADWVPGNVVGAAALREAGPGRAVRLVVDYLITGTSFGFSAGSMRTGQVLMADPPLPLAFRDGAVVEVTAGTRELTGPDGVVRANRATGTEHWTLPRLEPSVTQIDVYIAYPTPEPLTGAGPSEASRSRNQQLVSARAYDAAGDEIAGARIVAGNGYDYTGHVLAWAAETALTSGVRGTGALGPIDAFGLDALERFHDDLGVESTSWRSALPTESETPP